MIFALLRNNKSTADDGGFNNGLSTLQRWRSLKSNNDLSSSG